MVGSPTTSLHRNEPDDLPHQQLDGVVVPAVVHRLAGGRPIEPVWRNEIGGVTFRLGAGSSADYVKIGPPHREHDPASDAERLAWVSGYVTAPEPLGWGVDDGLAWLLTRGVPGVSAVSPEWRARPELAVPALGRALRAFHDRVPMDACPWTCAIEDRLAQASEAERAVLLATAPPLDLVVCHGDACNPNFLLDSDANPVGYVDLGALGVADRWADLAPACLSLGWNFGSRWADTVLDAYGIPRDDDKLDYYTRVWNAS